MIEINEEAKIKEFYKKQACKNLTSIIIAKYFKYFVLDLQLFFLLP